MPDRQLMEREAANDPHIESRIDNQDLAHQADRKPRAKGARANAENSRTEEGTGDRESR